MSVSQITTGAELSSIVGNGKLTVVDAFAEWCPPCKMIAPHIHELAKGHPNVNFVKFDVDQSAELSRKFNIEAMPTFIFIKGGAEVDRVRGANKSAIDAAVTKHQ
jgi:thioredoxin 1